MSYFWALYTKLSALAKLRNTSCDVFFCQEMLHLFCRYDYLAKIYKLRGQCLAQLHHFQM